MNSDLTYFPSRRAVNSASPSLPLLDRLSAADGADRLPRRWQEALPRDIEALFNAVALATTPGSAVSVGEWERCPHLRGSTLNFGLPAWKGVSLTPTRRREMAQALTHALRQFEPRLRPDSLSVHMRLQGSLPSAGPTVSVQIEAMVVRSLGGHPLSMVLELDADTGRARLRPGLSG